MLLLFSFSMCVTSSKLNCFDLGIYLNISGLRTDFFIHPLGTNPFASDPFIILLHTTTILNDLCNVSKTLY